MDAEKDGKNVIAYASRFGNTAIMKLLENGAIKNKTRNCGG
jgi:hypothetical protein